MANLLRTYLVGILFACIALMPVIIATWYCISQSLIYQQMETAMELELLESITFKTSDLIWLKAGKEILVDNKPFDVKKVHKIADSSVITGLFDHKEKKLKEILGKFDHSDKEQNNPVKITSPFSLFTPAQNIVLNALISPLLKEDNYLCYNELFRQNDYSLITAPPPRFT